MGYFLGSGPAFGGSTITCSRSCVIDHCALEVYPSISTQRQLVRMVGQFDIGLRSLLTTHSNEVTGDLHNRMPLILAERDWAKVGLGEELASSHELLALLIPMRC